MGRGMLGQSAGACRAERAGSKDEAGHGGADPLAGMRRIKPRPMLDQTEYANDRQECP